MKYLMFFIVLLFTAVLSFPKPLSVTCYAEDKGSESGPATDDISKVNGNVKCESVPPNGGKDSLYSSGKGDSSLKFRKLFPAVLGNMCRASQFSQKDSYTIAEAKGTVILLGLPPYKITTDEKLWVRIKGTLEIFRSDPSAPIRAKIEGCIDNTGKIIEFTEIQKLAIITPTVISGSAELNQTDFIKSGIFDVQWDDRGTFMCNDPDTSIVSIYNGKAIDMLIEINMKDIYPRRIAKLNMCVKVSVFAREFASRADFLTDDRIVGIFVYNPLGGNNNQQNQNNPSPVGKNKPFIGLAPQQSPYVIILPGANMPPDANFTKDLKDLPIFQFNMKAYNGDINISNIKVTVSNDYNSIAEAKLYIDKDSDGKLSSNDILLATAQVDQSGKLLFSINETIAVNEGKNFLVTLSTSDVQPKSDIQLSILLNQDVKVTTSNVSVLGAPIYSAIMKAVSSTTGKRGKNCSSFNSSVLPLMLILSILLARKMKLHRN